MSSTVIVNGVENSAIVVKEKSNKVVVTGVIGGISLDANFVYTQASPSAVWTINHNLNKYPSVTIVDSADNMVFGEVFYNSLNQVTLTFAGAFSGKAFIN
jgi:hypothetical protein